MYITLLIIGIVITSIAIIAITVFSISNFIVKKINKKERESMTDDEKRKEKLFSRSLKWLKRVLKLINKKLLENLWAFYGIASISIVGGVSMMVIGAVQENKHQQEMVSSTSEVVSSSAESLTSSTISTFSSSKEYSYDTTSSSALISSSIGETLSVAISSNNEVSSFSSESSSSIEASSSSDSSSSLSIDSSSSEPYVLSYTVRYEMDCEYDTSFSERSYPFELVVAESSFAEDYEERGTSVVSSQNIRWYRDAGHTEEFDFSTPITSNITLYGYISEEP